MNLQMTRFITGVACALHMSGALATDFGTPVIDIVDASTLKGVKRVAVTSFTVQYVTSQVWDTSYTTGGGPGNRTGNLQFVGQGGGFDVASALDPAKMQSTTDKLYQAFVTDLASAGFDVVSAEQLASSKAYQAYMANAPATPRKEEAEAQKSNGAGAITSVFYTPPAVPLVLGEKFDHLSAGTFGSNVGDPTLTFAGRLSLYTTNWPYYDKDVQKELVAATLHVRLYVPLAHVQVASGSFWGSGYSRQGIVPGLRLGNRLTRVTVGNNGDYAKLFLSDPFLIPGPIDSTIQEIPHTNPIRAMMGEKNKIYPGTLDVDKYWQLMPEAAAQALKAFTQKFKEGT
ncbi:MAG: hypothetical protein PHP05_09240 [Sideroxydans sp.]|nr:hypothetical protein [Sideroxydans sp.]